MRAILLILLLSFCLFWIEPANATRYTSRSIKRYVEQTPRQEEESLSKLVHHLVKPLDDKYDKAKAIAYWIAGHISYNGYLYNNGSTTKLIKEYKGQSAQELLESRVGICADYAKLFSEMCRIADIKCPIVTGYAYPSSLSKKRGQLANYRHAWNYFYYQNKKIYVDTTFMSRAQIGDNNRISGLAQRKALKDVKRDNKHRSQVHEFDAYYFNFNYKAEPQDKHYIHLEEKK